MKPQLTPVDMETYTKERLAFSERSGEERRSTRVRGLTLMINQPLYLHLYGSVSPFISSQLLLNVKYIQGKDPARL